MLRERLLPTMDAVPSFLKSSSDPDAETEHETEDIADSPVGTEIAAATADSSDIARSRTTENTTPPLVRVKFRIAMFLHRRES